MRIDHFSKIDEQYFNLFVKVTIVIINFVIIKESIDKVIIDLCFIIDRDSIIEKDLIKDSDLIKDKGSLIKVNSFITI